MGEKRGIKGEKSILRVFLIMLAVQMAMMLCLAAEKQDYHIDEIYSYILSNSFDSDKLVNSEALHNHWIDGGTVLREFVTVQRNERFAYQKVYLHNSADAHPPLFYYTLHTVCSLFPDSFSKWYGLSVNFVFFLLTQTVLFALSCRLFREDGWKLLPAALYGFSPLAADITLFVRMYAMLTFFTLLLFYLHYRMLEGDLKAPHLWCFATVFLGVYTQYFFAFSAFYLAVVWCLFLLSRRRLRELALYAGSMLAGVLLVLWVYPASIRQATGSGTNNVGNEVSSNILNFVVLPRHMYSYLHQFFSRMAHDSKPLLLCYLAAIAGIAAVAWKYREKDGGERRKTTFRQKLSRRRFACFFDLTLILGLTFITVAHISGSFSYLRYFYNVMPLFFLAAAGAVCYLVSRFRLNRRTVTAGLLALALAAGLHTCATGNCDYLMREQYGRRLLAARLIEDKPLVVLSKGKNHILTGNFMLLSSAERLYIADTEEIDADALLDGQEIPDGAVFLILDQTVWSDGFDGDAVMESIVSSSGKLGTYEKAGAGQYATFYWAHPAAGEDAGTGG